MKKIVSIVIVVALLATQFIVPTFANGTEVEKVTVIAQKDLIAFYNGSQETIDDKDVFVYDVTEADLWFELELGNGETFSGDLWDVSGYLDAGFSYDNIVCEGENHVGAYDVELNCEYFTATVTVDIVENPVKSVEAVATVPLYENWDGQWVEYCEDKDCDEYFEYDVYYAEPYFTITYKDGTVYEGTDEEIEEQTGFYTFVVDTQFENHWKVGTNTAKASFLGVECEFQVEVVKTPVKSITVETTFPLYENYSGYMETVIDEDGNETQYFEYYVTDSLPVFTITYNDGTVVEGTVEDVYMQTGFGFYFIENQNENPWKVGQNTATMVHLGYEFSFQVEVIKNPVVKVTGEAMSYLIENHSGFKQHYYDENGEETEFFWYDVYETQPLFTIAYEDGSTFTGTDEEIFWETGVWTFDITEQGESPWTVGENTARMSYLGYEFDVTFEVVESPVESVEITEEDGLSIIIKYKDDDLVEKVKAIDYVVEFTDKGMIEYIVTKTGALRCSLYPSVAEDGSESFYITVLGKDSNKLDNFDWLDATTAANEVVYSSLIYATGSEELFGKNFNGYNSADETQDLTQMAVLSTYLCEYYPEENDSYYYHNLDTDVVKENIKAVFGVEVNDLSSIDGYNKETGTVEIYEPMEAAYDYEVIDMNLVDGNWEKTYKVTDIESGTGYRIKVVLNDDITVDRIIFRLTGDLTGDGKLSAIDARQALQGVAHTKVLDEAQTLVADANADGVTSVIDARWILQAAAGTRVI